jgi:hypothetical protein
MSLEKLLSAPAGHAIINVLPLKSRSKPDEPVAKMSTQISKEMMKKR